MELIDLVDKDTTLRDYQIESKKNIYSAWKNSPRVLFQMPTGTGKTRLFSSIIRDIQQISAEQKERYGVLVIAHRTELIEQIDETLSQKYHIAHGIIKSGYPEDIRMPVQVASIQTLCRRFSNWSERQFAYIIIDEAHHALAKTYSQIIRHYYSAKVLGVTATPYRLSGESFRDLFGKLIVSQDVSKFIEQGHLCGYDYVSIKPNSRFQRLINEISDIGKDGDYAESALMNICDKDSIRANLIDSYLKYAKGKKGIIYTINRSHSEHICSEYKKIGVNIVNIDSETPSGERKQLVKDFKLGSIDIICNVNIFSEGFDCPDIEFIQLARPTLSLSLYLQQVGRGLRPSHKKTKSIIIDNVGLYNKFGLPSSRRRWQHYFNGYNPKEADTIIPSQNSGKERTISFEEGDEELELIYSTVEKECDSINIPSNEVRQSYYNAEHFPVGIKTEYDIFENNNCKSSILSNPSFDKEEKATRIRQLKEFNNTFKNFVDAAFGSIHYDDIESWIEAVDEHVDYDNFHNSDLWEKYHNLVRFTYNSLYGIAVKKPFSEIKTIINTDCVSLSDVFDIIIEPLYDEICIPDSSDQMVCYKDGKTGLIDGYSKTELLPFIYDTIITRNRSIYFVKKGPKWRIIQDSKRLPYIFDNVYPRTTLGSWFVEADNKYGLCSFDDNNIIVKWTFEPKKHLFSDMYLASGYHNGKLLTDEHGNIILPFLLYEVYETNNEKVPFVLASETNIYITFDGTFLSQEDPYIQSLSDIKRSNQIVINNNINSPKKKKLKSKIEITNYYIRIVKNQTEINRIDGDSIIKIGDNLYIVEKDKKYSIIKVGSNFIEKLSKLKFTSYSIINDQLISFERETNNSTERYHLNISSGDAQLALESTIRHPSAKQLKKPLFFIKDDNGITIVVNGRIKDTFTADEIVPIKGEYYKYKKNGLWGLLNASIIKPILIIKEPTFEDIQYDKTSRKIILKRNGRRPLIFIINR